MANLIPYDLSRVRKVDLYRHAGLDLPEDLDMLLANSVTIANQVTCCLFSRATLWVSGTYFGAPWNGLSEKHPLTFDPEVLYPED